jgi:hypothetical protein
MSNVINPLEISPTGHATRITFHGGEDLRWVAEINARAPDGQSEKRMRFTFIGTALVRIGDYEDLNFKSSYLLTVVPNSTWIAYHMDAYVKKFGPGLLSVVKNVKHYVLRGHDLTIGILARNVECSMADNK